MHKPVGCLKREEQISKLRAARRRAKKYVITDCGSLVYYLLFPREYSLFLGCRMISFTKSKKVVGLCYMHVLICGSGIH